MSSDYRTRAMRYMREFSQIPELTEKRLNRMHEEENILMQLLDNYLEEFIAHDLQLLDANILLDEIKRQKRRSQLRSIHAPTTPYLSIPYKNKDILKDAFNLILFHVDHKSGVYVDTKRKIKQIISQFLSGLYGVSGGEVADNEEVDVDDTDVSPRTLLQDPLRLSSCNQGRNFNECSYSLFFGNVNWYTFFRLLHKLFERLLKLYEKSQVLLSDVLKDRQASASLPPASTIINRHPLVEDFYPTFLQLTRELLNHKMTSTSYKYRMREMFGFEACCTLTLDVVIHNIVDELLRILADNNSMQYRSLFAEEQRERVYGGLPVVSSERVILEQLYEQKVVHQLAAQEDCFKIIVHKNEMKISFEWINSASVVDNANCAPHLAGSSHNSHRSSSRSPVMIIDGDVALGWPSTWSRCDETD